MSGDVQPVIILGGIRFGIATDTEAAAIAVLYALAVSVLVYRGLSLRELPTSPWPARRLRRAGAGRAPQRPVLLSKRAELLADWAAHCRGVSEVSKILPASPSLRARDGADAQ